MTPLLTRTLLLWACSWAVTDMSKELGKMWGEASDKEKEKFNKKAEEDKKRFATESEAYKSK